MHVQRHILPVYIYLHLINRIWNRWNSHSREFASQVFTVRWSTTMTYGVHRYRHDARITFLWERKWKNVTLIVAIYQGYHLKRVEQSKWYLKIVKFVWSIVSPLSILSKWHELIPPRGDGNLPDLSIRVLLQCILVASAATSLDVSRASPQQFAGLSSLI